MASMNDTEQVTFDMLIGKTITKIEGLAKGSEEVTFDCDDGTSYSLYHWKPSSESVCVEDVCGDVADLIGSPIVRAESPSNDDMGQVKPDGEGVDSWKWTFYILGTAKGTVTIRWLGESNDYYPSVEFAKIEQGTIQKGWDKP